MQYPYQCIESCNRSATEDSRWILFGGRGSKLVAQSSTGVASVWPPEDEDLAVSMSGWHEDEPTEPPGKKIKLSHSNDQISTFSSLTLSHDGQHLIAVTSEDKSIRVFQIDSDCNLRQLSQRCMARRPCAISLTEDDSTIFCADKFGDVYALPLIQPSEDEQNGTPADEPSEQDTPKHYVPAASVLTVHSGRNRKVLEEQMKQASKGQKKSKEQLKFKHELLLGHVSMLTDILHATVEGRSYIITSDRDEHIRISRGLPQAHIIEGFCFGHEEFISRLCLTTSGLLVSGGGDPYLCVWAWLDGRLLEKVFIRDAVLAFLKNHPNLASSLPENDDSFRIAVCGIWSVPRRKKEQDEILVACEGIPAVFSVRLDGTTTIDAVPLIGNALDVAFVYASEDSCTTVVSVDNIHKPGSTTEIREDEGTSRLQYFAHLDGRWEDDTKFEDKLEWFSRQAPNDARNAHGDEKAVRDTLYIVENLRKRPGAEDQD
ncbi:tRNA methyltransferas-like protein [Lophiotrema nucula]|uniref:tRNA methyltransferas-like protein n=1 Tax=Lophiotrema nucula TaxID=690887 RepID=A0A6A5ZJ93_9PLEO|nr:tRNA methyltransferas-like protein [Lophiotrema nucula]